MTHAAQDQVTQEVTLVTIHHERVATAVVLVLLITIMNQAEGVAELMPLPPPQCRATATATGLLVPRMHILKKNLLMLMKTVMLLAKIVTMITNPTIIKTNHVLEAAEILSTNPLLPTRVTEPMMCPTYLHPLVIHTRLLSNMGAWTFPEAHSS